MNSSFTDRGPCELCGEIAAAGFDLEVGCQGFDPCLGRLPGVSHACCGHGFTQPYVTLGGEPGQPAYTIEDFVTLRGEAALTFFRLLGKGPPGPAPD